MRLFGLVICSKVKESQRMSKPIVVYLSECMSVCSEACKDMPLHHNQYIGNPIAIYKCVYVIYTLFSLGFSKQYIW